jgi:hypothetical protein
MSIGKILDTSEFLKAYKKDLKQARRSKSDRIVLNVDFARSHIYLN